MFLKSVFFRGLNLCCNEPRFNFYVNVVTETILNNDSV
jgi:hypothetical protein